LLLPDSHFLGVAGLAGVYVFNVLAYSQFLKKAVIADVVSLSLGFVIRVLGGCAAAAIAPSTWLMNCTLFLAMFLAFAKRLGERRTAESAGFDVAMARGVQAKYTDHLLRMFVVVTAVAALVTYAGYVQSRDGEFAGIRLSILPGFNWLWITLVPATFALLRGIVQTEKGTFDDPTEMALHDRPLQVAVGTFGIATLAIMALKAGLIRLSSGV
jgi:decaprenyl-phosphate phosphoribosyltransferase